MLYRTFPQRQYGANEYLIPCAQCRYEFMESDLTKCAGQLELVCDVCLGYGDFEPIDRGNPICLECAAAYIRGDLRDCAFCSDRAEEQCDCGAQPVIWLDYCGPDPEHPELLWAWELAKTLNQEGI